MAIPRPCPLPEGVVYHGTDMDFDSFDFSCTLGPHFGTQEAACDRLLQTGRLNMPYSVEGSDEGGWYIEAKEFLNADPIVYGPFDSEDSAEGAALLLDLERKPIAYRLAITSPLVLEDLGGWSFSGLLRHFAETNLLDNAHERDQLWEAWQKGDAYGWAGMREALLCRGYDAIAYENAIEDRGSVSWIVLDPQKIEPAWMENQVPAHRDSQRP